ncbi:hypothetical protein F5B20DRAFT_129883 [Whalleya microplaca]|nr:hypothetical protein F5B20DRAFT_129883 [Whalleya microplaca]
MQLIILGPEHIIFNFKQSVALSRIPLPNTCIKWQREKESQKMVGKADNITQANTKLNSASDHTKKSLELNISVLTLCDEHIGKPNVSKISDLDSLDKHITLSDTGTGSERMFIVNGLHFNSAQALASRLDIDPAFFDAHLLRTRYVPLDDRWDQAQSLQLEYPDIEQFTVQPNVPQTQRSEDSVALSEVVFNPDRKDEYFQCRSKGCLSAFMIPLTPFELLGDPRNLRWFAKFQRMSWWRSNLDSKNSILLIDRDLRVILTDQGLRTPSLYKMKCIESTWSPFLDAIQRANQDSDSRSTSRIHSATFSEKLLHPSHEKSTEEAVQTFSRRVLSQWQRFASLVSDPIGSGWSHSASEVFMIAEE